MICPNCHESHHQGDGTRCPLCETNPREYVHLVLNFQHWDLWCGVKGCWRGYHDYVEHVTQGIKETTCHQCLERVSTAGDLARDRIIELESLAAMEIT